MTVLHQAQPPTDDLALVAVARRAGRIRSLIVAVVLAVVLAGLAVLALMLGDRVVAPGDVLATLLGGGSGGDRFVILGLRVPRLLLGLMVGAGFGLAGAVFQSLL